MTQNLFDYLKIILLIQIFFSVGVTMLTHALPDDVRGDLDILSNSGLQSSGEEIAGKLEETATRQTSFAVVDIAVLAVYSGNIFIDLLFNFIFALPEMLNIIMSTLFLFIPLEGTLRAQVQIFFFVVVTITYIMALLKFLLQTRSTSAIV